MKKIKIICEGWEDGSGFTYCSTLDWIDYDDGDNLEDLLKDYASDTFTEEEIKDDLVEGKDCKLTAILYDCDEDGEVIDEDEKLDTASVWESDFKKTPKKKSKRNRKSEISLKDIECGETFTYNGYEFIKLADEKDSCYCLLNDTAYFKEYCTDEVRFGKTNDWAKSIARRWLNEFDENGDSKVLPNINKNDLVAVNLDYTAYQIPDGNTKDYLTALSSKEYGKYEIERIAGSGQMLLRDGCKDSADYIRIIDVDATVGVHPATFSYNVQPALHFKKDLEVYCGD